MKIKPEPVVFTNKFFQIYFAVFLFIVIASCNTGKIEEEHKASPVDQELVDTFSVKNPKLYSPAFLDKLRASGFAKTYELVDSLLIMNGSDTAIFSLVLPWNKKLEFTGSNDNMDISLIVSQKNYTTISFALKVYRGGQLSDEETGEADLGALFFLGAESDDDETGASYLSLEYWLEKDCETAIRIGYNYSDELRAKITRHCPDSSKNIDLDDSPSLSVKK